MACIHERKTQTFMKEARGEPAIHRVLQELSVLHAHLQGAEAIFRWPSGCH